MLSIPEYKENNGNVYLTLRNKVSGHSKTIRDSIISKIENKWNKYNDTQRKILLYLFMNYEATLTQLVDHTEINRNTVRNYLNKFIKEGLAEKKSKKQRDINAKYRFKKH